jgi:Fur family ferric uptake transcriptional regulator
MNTSKTRSPSADEKIRQTGSRATRARINVLEVLLTADHALTHTELEYALNRMAGGIERVTLYRVLDWLVSHDLAHKIIGADRIWRFNAQNEPIPRHAHFNCSACGRVFCLENAGALTHYSLPKGFTLEKAELSIEGHCPDCNKSC